MKSKGNRYRIEWSKTHNKHYNLFLNKESCEDIIEFLEAQSNVQGLLKKLIREEIARRSR